MNLLNKSFNTTIPLALTAHFQAEKLRSRQTNLNQAKQVYLNTLAVYAVQTYLQWRGFETDWKNSESASSVMQNLIDVADLIVTDLGKIECRFVLPGAKCVKIPEEVCSNRLAFVVVCLHESLREATLLGFLKTATKQEFLLEELQPMDEFVPYLCKLQAQQIQPQQTQLIQWLDNIVDASWETLETLLTSTNLQPAFNFRRVQNHKIERGKLLKLAPAGVEVIFIVRLIPTSTPDIDISVEIYPSKNEKTLPPNLQLMILDETEQPVMQTQAGVSEALEFQFSAEMEEKFSVKVVLGNASFTEIFTLQSENC